MDWVPLTLTFSFGFGIGVVSLLIIGAACDASPYQAPNENGEKVDEMEDDDGKHQEVSSYLIEVTISRYHEGKGKNTRAEKSEMRPFDSDMSDEFETDN